MVLLLPHFLNGHIVATLFAWSYCCHTFWSWSYCCHTFFPQAEYCSWVVFKSLYSARKENRTKRYVPSVVFSRIRREMRGLSFISCSMNGAMVAVVIGINAACKASKVLPSKLMGKLRLNRLLVLSDIWMVSQCPLIRTVTTSNVK